MHLNYSNLSYSNTLESVGIPIIITNRYKERRKHKKKRINKKYAKKYGYIKCGLPIEDGKIYKVDGKLYMNQATYNRLMYTVDPRWGR